MKEMLDFGDFQKFLEMAKQTFICLRCGECCFAWAVPMPDGSMKPERQNCGYLIPRQKLGKKWQQASCTIHEAPEYPRECREAVLGPGFCPLGTAIWKHLKDKDPEDEFPEVVEEAIYK